MEDKIFHIYWGTSGNSGLYLDEIYQCLKKAGYSQKIFVSYYYPFEYGEKIFFRHSDIAHCKLKGYARKILQFYEIITAFLFIILSCMKEKPKVVNYSLISGSYFIVVIFLLLLKRLSRCKLVVTCHDVCPWGSYSGKSIEVKNRQRIFKIADYLLVHNENSIIDLIQIFGINSKKIVRHLFPIMDLTKLLPIKNTTEKLCDFLFIGHLRKDKGIDFLIESWTRFHQQNKIANLWICGRPQGQIFDVESMRKLNVTCNLEYIDDVSYCHYIQSARYVVFPYLKGTNSGVISTVLSLGANVITSDIAMFHDYPLIKEDCMFKSGNVASFVELLQRKFSQDDSNHMPILLSSYREQFKIEVLSTYKAITGSG